MRACPAFPHSGEYGYLPETTDTREPPADLPSGERAGSFWALAVGLFRRTNREHIVAGILESNLVALEYSRHFVNALLEAMTEDQLCHQPFPGANHALWIPYRNIHLGAMS
jgi:hypothetical protein